MTATDVTEIGDVVIDVERDGLTGLPTSHQLYYRWERHHWSVAALDLAADAEGWTNLRTFARTELLGGMLELHAGEVCVTETLSSLVDFAPEPDDNIYLCTQLVDEARHVRFFGTYLDDVVASGPETRLDRDDVTKPYERIFEPELRARTGAVREQRDDPGAWFEALVYYHLVTEGILAATALRSTLHLVRSLGTLPKFTEGLTNVARDESRHVQFGLGRARAGIERGYGDRIAARYLDATSRAAQVLVGADRHNPPPVLRIALRSRAEQLKAQWTFARTKMRRHMSAMGLSHLEAEATSGWDKACELALDEYQERWGEEHPVRAAGLVLNDEETATR